MRIEELQALCEEAARELLRTHSRPLAPTVVLPGSDRTRLVELRDFPADEQGRREVLAHFAHDEIVEGGVPCYGFLEEGETDSTDVLVVVYGARRHHPMVTAAGLGDEGLTTPFEEPEELDPGAFPWLHPLQQAVDSLDPAEAPPEPGEGGDLPLSPE